jgi:hypothetical protein
MRRMLWVWRSSEGWCSFFSARVSLISTIFMIDLLSNHGWYHMLGQRSDTICLDNGAILCMHHTMTETRKKLMERAHLDTN